MSGAHPDTPRRTGQGHCHCQICIILGFRVFLGYRLAGFSIQGLGWHVSGCWAARPAAKKGGTCHDPSQVIKPYHGRALLQKAVLVGMAEPGKFFKL